MYLRLRQLCLVAHELDPVVQALQETFDIEVCHRDPGVGQFGLHNALLPVGNSFIEVVAPIRDDTTAARYLERRHGDGGYMVILDTDDLSPWQQHVDSLGVRVAASLAIDDYQGMQLHPRDTGGALLEINWTRGGESLQGPYGPAGPAWTDAVRTGRVQAITGAELQSDDPARLAERWAQILRRSATAHADSWSIALDNAHLRFVHAKDGRGEGLGGIDVRTDKAAEILRAAQACGLDSTDDTVCIGGIRFYLAKEASWT